MRLQQLRKQKNLSQLQLAMALNMNQNSISRYETGEREADYKTLILFADYFNVSIDYLVGRTDEQTPSANNINSSFVQSNGSVTLGSVSVGSTFNSNSNAPSLSQEETEILDIYRKLNIRGKAQFLNMALEIEKGIGREF